jgi:hypothetical protein
VTLVHAHTSHGRKAAFSSIVIGEANMFSPTDQSHVLATDITLVTPVGFKGAFSKDATNVVAREMPSGSVLTYLCQPGAKGVSTAQLLQSLTAMMQKRHPGAAAPGAAQPATGEGWSGLVQMLRVGSALNQPLRIVITALVLPDLVDATKQRNLAVILEVADAEFDRRLMFYRRFAELRLRVGPAQATAAVQINPSATAPELSLLPMADAPADTAETNTIESVPAARRPSPRNNRRAIRDKAPMVPSDDERLELAARGQRAVIFSIVLSFVVNGLHRVPDMPVLLTFALSVALLFYATHGVLRMASAFGLSKTPKLLLMLASSVPIANLVCWIVLSMKTTRLLRDAGFQVGLLGVRS